MVINPRTGVQTLVSERYLPYFKMGKYIKKELNKHQANAKKFKTEVLIIGVGLAGSSAAHQLAKKGVDVVIVDSRKTIGVPVQCARIYSKTAYAKKSLKTTLEIQ